MRMLSNYNTSNSLSDILSELEKCDFKVSTDSRGGVAGTIFFALKGANFDGSEFVCNALEKGAQVAVTDNLKVTGERVYHVEDVLESLQESAKSYRERFNIPIIAIGGSNGKTTSKELVSEVLKTKYKVHASKGNLNNHIGVPLSILSMDRDAEIGIFEIGANHHGEHLALLDILRPTIVVVTNNGSDHLEGFGSLPGVRSANKEIYDWARGSNTPALVNKELFDLMEDSQGLERILYPLCNLEVLGSTPLSFRHGLLEHPTHLVGDYNIANIQMALAFGDHFDINENTIFEAICGYVPSSNRSRFIKSDGANIVLDCYNANPSSMSASLESFFRSTDSPRAVVLGDMLELGKYSEQEHQKIVEYVSQQNLDIIVFIGENFKNALKGAKFQYQWFPSFVEAREWFKGRNFKGFNMLLKGSRGIAVEKVLNM